MGRWSVVAAIALAFVIAACTSDAATTMDSSTTSSSSVGASTATETPKSATGLQSDERLPEVFFEPVDRLDDAEWQRFLAGQEFFNEVWTPVGPTETGNDGLGPLFNADSCAVCHPSTGRRQVPPEGELTDVGLIVRLSVQGSDPVTGAPLPEPNYGDQLQDRAIGANEPEGTIFTNYVIQQGTYPDGTPFELLWPTVNIRDRNHGPLTEGVQVSARIGAQLIGMGLLEAVPADSILAAADPNDANGDGISGRPNLVWNPAVEGSDLGRFGWKANIVQLDQQVAQAFHGDLGVTSTLIESENCTAGQDMCSTTPNGGTHEVSDQRLEAITHYLRLLAVPEPRTAGDPRAETGETLFDDFGCAGCHTETLQTGQSVFSALAEQTIHPYTDLLLHDLGFDMADDRPDFAASGVEWRTAPLWGLGLVPVEDDRGLLHDGRARTIEEAILWHGGEGSGSRAAFMRAELSDRQALIAFLESL